VSEVSVQESQGFPDTVVVARALLSPADWERLNRHPVLGAALRDGRLVIASVAGVAQSDQERPDDDGYLNGNNGPEISLLSDVIANCDAFLAVTSARTDRREPGAPTTLQRGVRACGSRHEPYTSADILTNEIARFDVVPAFAPACERVLAAIETEQVMTSEIIEAIEGDAGLTVAILRRAQSVTSRRPIANVANAIAALSAREVAHAVEALPRAEFPWQTSPLEALIHRFRVHALAVARAAERISRHTESVQINDLRVAALLHDVGKLVLARAIPDYTSVIDGRSTPEERVRQEQRAWGMDHANLGGLLLRRWGLPNELASSVAAHHSSGAESDVATYIRLADMIVHHTEGEAIDRSKMLRLADRCGLSAGALRDVLFDLPQGGAGQRRHAEPSPLSSRETVVLKILAKGKVYKAIALELGLSTSTVRTHLHNTYAKLGVDDRAQAVLRATEMGWI
jgi:putative nucleotidyltransferase with HDIG domain